MRFYRYLQTLTFVALVTPILARAAVPAAAIFFGAVDGVVLRASTAYFNTYTDSQGNQGQVYVVSDQNNFCSLLTQGASMPSANTLVIAVTHGSNIAFPDTGDYAIAATQSGPLTGQARFFSTDAQCINQMTDMQSHSTGGRVTTSYVTANVGLGAYSLRLGNQNDLVSGSFHALPCPAIDSNFIDGVWSKACP